MKQGLREVPLTRVTVTDEFWAARQRQIAEIAVPYMERVLRDEVPGAAKSHAIENFRIAAGEAQGRFYGMVFQDSDVAKWIETASYSLLVKPDAALEARLDALISTIARVQRPDGYLDTYFAGKPEARWTNLLECHELYCAGHMLEAAVAHFEVTGKRNLLNVGVRLADCIVERFREGEDIPGHQEIEIGLMRLFRATGDARYRDMAKRFLDRRGQNPDYFRTHTPPHPSAHFFRGDGAEDAAFETPGDDPYAGYDIDPTDTDYNQSYAPVREQTEARGHAVRFLYMLTAMADAAEATRDEGLRSACERLFDHVTRRQMYVTGGLGGTVRGEAFLPDFELPNGTAYAETCASVAMAFFCQRMLNLTPDGRFADILELELYNGALSGISLDGTRYFYVNPLEVVPGVSGVAPGYEHALPERQRWMSCACCPPNLARLIESLGRYLWSESEGAIYSHLFVGSRARTELAEVELTTGFPWRGGAEYLLRPRTKVPFALMIRIPAYAKNLRVLLNGEEIDAVTSDGEEIGNAASDGEALDAAASDGEPSSGWTIERGYLRVRRTWREGDRLTLEFDLLPRRIYADPRVRADEGCVALARGPFVYCFEGADNPTPLENLRVPADARIDAVEVPELCVEGLRVQSDPALTAIPYYAWANRGVNEMRVWMREEFSLS